MQADLPASVLLDVPAVEAWAAEQAGAVKDVFGRLWVNPRLVQRSDVALWLKPRTAHSNDDSDYVHATVLAMPYRCWRMDCRQESLAVVAYNKAKSTKSGATPGTTYCYDESPLELVAAALRDVHDLPDDLASLGRRYSKTADSVYMSNGCRRCHAIFGHTPLAEAYTRLQELGRLAVVQVAQVRLRNRPSEDEQALPWDLADWAEGEQHFGPVNEPPGPAGSPRRPDAMQRIVKSRHRAFGDIWGSGIRDLGREHLTIAEFEELLTGSWDSKWRVSSRMTDRFDRSVGTLVPEGGAGPGGFEVWLGAEPALVELLLSIDDDHHFGEVEEALTEAAYAAARSLEAGAYIARVSPETRDTEHEIDAKRTSSMQGAPTIPKPAHVVAGPTLRRPPLPSSPTRRGMFADLRAAIHLVIPRLCWLVDPDGELRFYTADEFGIRRQARERNAVFLGTLATELDDLGYRLQPAIQGDDLLAWTIEGSNPLFGMAWTQAHEPMRAVLSDFAHRGSNKPDSVEVLAQLRATRAAREKFVAVFDRAESRRDLLEMLGDRGAAPGPFERTAPTPRQSVETRQAELTKRVREELGSRTRQQSVQNWRTKVFSSVARSAVRDGLSYDEIVEVASPLFLEQARGEDES